MTGPRVPETEGFGQVAERVRNRRQGALRPIDRMLLHSPVLADGWNVFLGALRGGLALAGDIRELVILRIAVLNDAPYEWDSHVRPARTEGLTESEFEAVREGDAAEDSRLSEAQRSAIALADSMTRQIRVPDSVFDAARRHFAVAELVELVATIAAYNMVSRFAEALQISETKEDA